MVELDIRVFLSHKGSLIFWKRLAASGFISVKQACFLRGGVGVSINCSPNH